MAVRTSTDGPPWEQFDPEIVQEAIADIQLKFRTNFSDLSSHTNVDIRDLNLIQNDPNFVKKFVLQEYFLSTEPKFPSNTAIYQIVLKALEFRHEYHVNDLTARDIPPLVLRAGFCYTHGVDKQGNTISYLIVRKNRKDPELKKASKLYAVYLVHKLLSLCPDRMMTIFIDSTEAGVSNMDLELIRFLVNLFRYYFPLRLGWMLIHNMPWMLTATWNLVKRWLPPKSRDRIVFTSPSDITIYISEDQLLSEYGGNVAWRYQYPLPDEETDTLLGQLIYTGDRENDENSFLKSFDGVLDNGKITTVGDLLDNLDSPVSNSVVSPLTPNMSEVSFNKELIAQKLVEISPKDLLVFSPDDNCNPCIVKISVKNVSSLSMSFKIKATNLTRYKVSPTLGVIEPDHLGKISIALDLSSRPDLSMLAREVSKDRFLIMTAAYPFDRANTPGHIIRFWRKLDTHEVANYIFNTRLEYNSAKELILDETADLVGLSSKFKSLESVLCEASRKQKTLWNFLLILCALFLLNSYLLSRRYKYI